MARLFPLRSKTPETEDRPRVVDLEGEDADAVFGALSSTTARRIYARLAEEPATPSDVAEAVDTSIQNARYHLESLEEAGLIEVVDTWYSSRGNEMSVYAASDGPLVVAADRSRADRLREALSRYLGGLAVLAGASLFVQYGLERLVSAIDSFGSPGFGGDDSGPEEAGDAPAEGDDPGEDDAEGGDAGSDRGTGEEGAADDARETEAADEGEVAEEEETGVEDIGGGNESSANDTGIADDGAGANETGGADANATDPPGTDATDTPTPTETATPTETPTPTETDPVGTGTPADQAPEAADAVLGTIPPGVVFFLGGLLVLTLVTVWWYGRPY